MQKTLFQKTPLFLSQKQNNVDFYAKNKGQKMQKCAQMSKYEQI